MLWMCACGAILRPMLAQVSSAQGAKVQNAKLDPINPDRPDFTNSPEIVALGHVQIETGVLWTRSGSQRLAEFGDGATLRVPISKTAEVRFNAGSLAFSEDSGVRTQGLESVGIGAKVKISEGSKSFSWSHPKLGLEGDFIFPTGSADFRENSLQMFGSLLSEWDFDGNNALGVQIRLGSPSQNGEHFTQWAASASFGHQFTNRTSGFLELFGLFPGAPRDSNLAYADSGVQYLLNNDTMLDVHGGIGLNGTHPDYFFGAGLSVRF